MDRCLDDLMFEVMLVLEGLVGSYPSKKGDHLLFTFLFIVLEEERA